MRWLTIIEGYDSWTEAMQIGSLGVVMKSTMRNGDSFTVSTVFIPGATISDEDALGDRVIS